MFVGGPTVSTSSPLTSTHLPPQSPASIRSILSANQLKYSRRQIAITCLYDALIKMKFNHLMTSMGIAMTVIAIATNKSKNCSQSSISLANRASDLTIQKKTSARESI